MSGEAFRPVSKFEDLRTCSVRTGVGRLRSRLRGKRVQDEIVDELGVRHGFIELFPAGHRFVGASGIAESGRVGCEGRRRRPEVREIAVRFGGALHQREKVVGLG